MAVKRKFVSPGVFTRELDQSHIAQGVGNIGACVIGRTAKGPGLAPWQVTDFNEFVARFGDVDPTMVAPYAVKNYLLNSSICTEVRVLGDRSGAPDPTKVSNAATYTPVPIVDANGDVRAVINVLSGTTFTLTGSTAYPTYSFSGSAGTQFTGTYAGTLSFLVTDPTYIGNVLNTDPTLAFMYGHWLYQDFAWAGVAGGAAYNTSSLAFVTGFNPTASFDFDFSNSKSPTIYSQLYGSSTFPLFDIFTISDGYASTKDVKVSIANIKSSANTAVTKYGTFDVIVRVFTDTDARPTENETFTGLTLDPKAANFLPRVIGDQYRYWNAQTQKLVTTGTFKNFSKYIRVKMATANAPQDAVPYGHGGYPSVGTAVSGAQALLATPWVTDNLDSQNNLADYTYWGLDFTQPGVADLLKSTGNPNGIVAYTSGVAFSLNHLSGANLSGVAYTAYNTGTVISVPASSGVIGFTVGFYGGFDGFDETQVDPLAPTAPNSIAVVSLKKAIDLISNPEELDINLLVIPGVYSQPVTSYAEQACNNRADCFFIMDLSGSSVSDAVSKLSTQGIDDNYAGVYYPPLRYSDTTNNVIVPVPASVAMLGVMAYNDRVGQVFFAPAGLTRGGLAQFGIVDVVDRLNFSERDTLYAARINPIASFPNEGIVAWGQKTLQVEDSALNRINVRRLLIYAKKTIASVAKYLVFEPNNPSTWQRFTSTVNPILDKVRADQGLERFKVVMDSTVNTPDLIDREIMTGKIFLQPTRAAEFIDLSFIISASGVEFEE